MNYFFQTIQGPVIGRIRVKISRKKVLSGFIVYDNGDYHEKSKYFGKDNIILYSAYQSSYMSLYFPYEEIRENLIKFIIKEML